ncbi:MAG: lytic transglycosylase domain-containing protein [Gemmatimonadetes bacterium]|nr:lytic transglycosylase domain-containing protein [Gemmatimonadota bacterium]
MRVLAGAGALLLASAGAQVAVQGLGRGERLAEQLRLAQGQIELLRISAQRFDSLFRYSARYKVPADLAALIYDGALREGLDPDLGFRLVNAESGFEPRAVSSAGAVGLVQLMPNTARALMPGITMEQIFEPETNLHLGFKLLRQLIARYDGDLRLALVDYNGGPRKVSQFLQEGHPGVLAYVRMVMGRR